MISGFIEVSQESVALAEAEAVSAAEALGGSAGTVPTAIPHLVAIDVPHASTWEQLGARLALARRCLVRVGGPAGDMDPAVAAKAEGAKGGSAAFRRIGQPSGSGADPGVLESGRAFKLGGGTIDLESPTRRFWLARDAHGRELLLEEIASVDRGTPTLRRMPLLPFRRPVGLSPKLARAAMNLARVSSSDRVLDPFLGTGALLAEAGLLGAELYGVDADATMVRGALQNLAYLGVSARGLSVGDARVIDFPEPDLTFSAIVTDPPYGRASSTGGEESTALVIEVVERWWKRLAPGGRLLVIVPSGGPPLEFDGPPRFRVPVRVHRSLTREFCLFERGGATARRS